MSKKRRPQNCWTVARAIEAGGTPEQLLARLRAAELNANRQLVKQIPKAVELLVQLRDAVKPR